MAKDPRARAIVEEILRRRPDLDEEQVWDMIYRKMKQVGAGYLTEVGAGYLVASDLGVDLTTISQPSLRLSELKAGMRRVDVRALFLKKGRELSFEGREGGVGKAHEYYVFDVGLIARLVVWGDPDYRRALDSLKPGDAVRLRGASVRQGRDGSLEVHLDSRGNVEPEGSAPAGDLIETITLGVGELDKPTGPGRFLVVKGKLASPVFVRFYGREGEERVMSYFALADEDGKRSVRAVLWGQEGEELQELGVGSEVRLIGVRAREGRNGLELHGDEGTLVEVLSRLAPRGPSEDYLLISSDFSPPGSQRAEALLSAGDQLLRITASGGAAQKLASAQPGSLVKFRRPSAAVVDEGDFEVVAQRPAELERYRVSVKDLEGYQGRACVFEGIVLSKPLEKEVTSRSGERLRLATALLGDHTGELEVNAWRDQADKLLQLKVGDRVTVFGAVVVRREGRPPSLDVKGYTRVTTKEASRGSAA